MPTRSWRTAGRRPSIVAALYVGIPHWAITKGAFEAAPTVLGISLAMLLGAYLTCLWLGWYFFLCLQWNGHGNEAGTAARVVTFAQFLRIKLTPDRAEVWVIAAEGPRSPARPWWRPWQLDDLREKPPCARLIDHFVLEQPKAEATG